MAADAREESMAYCDLYVDTMYTFPYAFSSLRKDINDLSLTNEVMETKTADVKKSLEDSQRSEVTLLDLYCGCGASTSADIMSC